MNLKKRSVAELEALRGEIGAEIARRADVGIELVSCRGARLAKRPKGGHVLHVQFAAEPATEECWYPKLESAKAALAKVATRWERVPSDDLMHVDLTAPGCATSEAWIS